MTPEIFHRCESCGVAIREQAMFCPDCGKPLAITPQTDARIKESSAARNDPEVSSARRTAAGSASNEKPSGESEIVATAASSEAINAQSGPSPTPERHGARERTRETLHRASTAARGAIERPVKQVEKIHHVSTVMLDEAHSDPSLRFVLVALGLFILFIILLVLSKVMG